MKNLFVIILSVLSIKTSAQSQQDTTLEYRLKTIENRLLEIEEINATDKIKMLDEKIDFQLKMNEQSNSSISNQLDSAAYNLSLFGILFGIGALGLGLYVTYIERKIVKIGEENKELLSKNLKIKQDVEDLNKLIQSDIYNLFLKIKREESIHIIERLVKVPKDISNVCDSLLSRELHQDDYPKIKQAFLNLPNKEEGNYAGYYLTVFFQHFLGQALRDSDLREDIANFLPLGIEAAFENDITKCTSDFVSVIIDMGIQELKFEINSYFEGLTKSDYKTFQPVYEILFDNLNSRKLRFDIFNVIQSTEENRIAKIEYGKLLQKKYENDNPSESELSVFSELIILSDAQKKAEEEAKQKAEEQKRKRQEKQKRDEELKKKLEEQKKKSKRS